MQRALATQPESPYLRFNVAFIQFQIATLINSAKDNERTLEDVDAAIVGLEEAITTFDEVAQHKSPPYPKAALEQRSTMGRNTIRRQLQTARERQEKYERENAEKLAEAKAKRDDELRRRDELRKRKEAEDEERQRKVQEEREKIVQETELMAQQYRAEAAAREAAEYTDDSETGDRVKRKEKKRKAGAGAGKKRKKRDDVEDGFIEDDEESGSERSVSRTPVSGSEAERGTEDQPRKKRRKLERRGARTERKQRPKPANASKKNKFKSAEVIDSDEEDEAVTPAAGLDDDDSEPAVDTPPSNVDEDEQVGRRARGRSTSAPAVGDDDDDDDEVVRQPVPRKRKQLRIIADDAGDEEDEGGAQLADDDKADLASAAMAAVEGLDDED
jgi:RNA polymerase-associated protein CTR9